MGPVPAVILAVGNAADLVRTALLQSRVSSPSSAAGKRASEADGVQPHHSDEERRFAVRGLMVVS